MLALLLLCIIHDVTSIHHRENNGMNRQFDKQKYFNLNDSIYRSMLEHSRGGKYNKSEEYRDDYYEREPRRLFDWSRDVIKSNTSYKTTPGYEDVIKEKSRFREIEKNLTDILTELSSVLKQILVIVNYARHEDLEFDENLQHALDNKKHISKRNAVDKDDTNNTETDSANELNKNSTVDNTTQSIDESNGRRSMMQSKVFVTTDEVKNKLFNYIEEGFTEVRNLINSLKPVKNMFATDIRYQIGYIIANIDTLKANMNNLEKDVTANRYSWSDKKILNLYDTVKMSNRAVTNLIDVLKGYIENSLNSNYYQ